MKSISYSLALGVFSACLVAAPQAWAQGRQGGAGFSAGFGRGGAGFSAGVGRGGWGGNWGSGYRGGSNWGGGYGRGYGGYGRGYGGYGGYYGNYGGNYGRNNWGWGGYGYGSPYRSYSYGYSYPSYNYGYSTPSYGYTYSSPAYGGTYAQQQSPITLGSDPDVQTASRGAIEILNPDKNGAALSFQLNQFSQTVQPGQTARVQDDREWTIEFHRGGQHGQAAYSLSAGRYKFVPTRDGWDLVRAAEDSAAAETAERTFEQSESVTVQPRETDRLEAPDRATDRSTDRVPDLPAEDRAIETDRGTDADRARTSPAEERELPSDDQPIRSAQEPAGGQSPQ